MSAWMGRGLAAIVMLSLSVSVAADAGPTISGAWARATAPGIDVGAVYMVVDGGTNDDEIVAASTARAAMVHLHTVEDSAGVAKMRAVEGVPVPAGKRAVLAPKGTHIMLMGLAQPLVAGESFVLTLKFAKAGDRTVNVAVLAAGADGPPAKPPR